MKQLAPGDYEPIANGLYLEGLAVDHVRDIIWYSDVIGGGIHGIKPDGAQVGSFNEGRMWTGGIAINADGSVLSTGQGGIMWNNPDTGRSGWLIDEIDGVPINGINEMAPDGEGGMFFGTNDIEMIIDGKDVRPSTLYRLTADRKLIKLVDGIGFTNGIAYDRPGKRFHCNDTFRRTWTWDVTPDLSLVNQRVLIEKEDCDGMALDAEGNVWITGFRSQYLERIRPDGTALPRIETPKGSITQVRFAGPDLRDFYINTVPADGGDTLKEGGAITQRNSILYRGRSETPGRTIEPTGFTLA
jgi:sugar lactone lactonase YvrE